MPVRCWSATFDGKLLPITSEDIYRRAVPGRTIDAWELFKRPFEGMYEAEYAVYDWHFDTER